MILETKNKKINFILRTRKIADIAKNYKERIWKMYILKL